MAERLKHQLLHEEQIVDIVAGPDSYRRLPHLVAAAMSGQRGINVELSREETYSSIQPVRYASSGISAYVSIMRGCNNMCSYCVVPFTRGRERSRHTADILAEINQLKNDNYKEITLLGQNVNSFLDGEVDFVQLLSMAADAAPDMRIRFSTSHPKDISENLLHTMVAHKNICRHIHLPVQSGSSRILKLMNRHYTREDYMDKIAAIRRILPDAAISTDIIAGFCTETAQDHQATMQLMRAVGYDFAYMFAYSQRPDTAAARMLADDVPHDEKISRLNQIIALQGELSLESKRRMLGSVVEVLIEGNSKRTDADLCGRTSQNHVVVFARKNYAPGDYAHVSITACTAATLTGEAVECYQ
jgi:tRNA-2-methylthio-N6-dimethylallyladenosine synthase